MKDRAPARHHKTKRTVREEAEMIALAATQEPKMTARELTDAIVNAIRLYAKIPFSFPNG